MSLLKLRLCFQVFLLLDQKIRFEIPAHIVQLFHLAKFTQPLKSQSNLENMSKWGVLFYLLFKDFSDIFDQEEESDFKKNFTDILIWGMVSLFFSSGAASGISIDGFKAFLEDWILPNFSAFLESKYDFLLNLLKNWWVREPFSQNWWFRLKP